MQMSGENRTIVSCGLADLEHSDFIGLHALLREAGLSSREISSVQIGFVLAPRINAAGRMGAADMAAGCCCAAIRRRQSAWPRSCAP